MVVRTIQVELDEALDGRLRRMASETGRPEKQLVREALERFATESEPAPALPEPEPGESLYDRLQRAGLLGCEKNLPPDLSTNPKYMEGFGE